MFSDFRRLQEHAAHLLAMLRQAVYGRLAGYEDVNDAERLRVDPAMRRVVGGRAKTKEAASTSEMSRFETEWLSSRERTSQALMNLSGTWIDSVQECAPLDKLILDLDNSGQRDAWRPARLGRTTATSDTPAITHCSCSTNTATLERALLRRGNHNSAKFWRRALLPVIDRYRDRAIPKYFRGDAAFAVPALYRFLEEGELPVRHPHAGETTS